MLNWWKSSTGSELAFSAKLATLRKHLEKCFSMLFNAASSAERKIQREKKPPRQQNKKRNQYLKEDTAGLKSHSCIIAAF